MTRNFLSHYMELLKIMPTPITFGA